MQGQENSPTRCGQGADDGSLSLLKNEEEGGLSSSLFFPLIIEM